MKKILTLAGALIVLVLVAAGAASANEMREYDLSPPCEFWIEYPN